jgi:ABC-type ATPase with predicted acetyltransferase domain
MTLAPWICTDCGKIWETNFWPEFPEVCPYCQKKTVMVDCGFDKRYIRRDVEDW